MAYDPSTTLGYTRLLIADTVEASYIFTDPEITAFLARAGDSPERAGAAAIRALCADRAKLSKRIERDGYKSEQFAIADLLQLAEALEESASSVAGLASTLIDGGDTVFDSYRPGFVDTANPPAGYGL